MTGEGENYSRKLGSFTRVTCMAEPLDSVFHLAFKGNFGHECSWM